VEDRDQRFEKLLATMGIDETDHFTRFSLEQGLEEIERNYMRLVVSLEKPPDRKEIRQYRAQITKLLTLTEKIGPTFFANEVEKAGWSRQNPDADDRMLNILMADHSSSRDEVVAALTRRGLDIDHWLRTTGNAATYRKRGVRKVVVEPFLRLMTEHEITTGPKHRPRKQMFDALFDWLGVEPRDRPSSANVDAIARELEDSASG
jgi:hypothetical protein